MNDELQIAIFLIICLGCILGLTIFNTIFVIKNEYRIIELEKLKEEK